MNIPVTLICFILLSYWNTTIWRSSDFDELESTMAMNRTRIPKLTKFTGDDSLVNFKTWLSQYEAQATALAVPAGSRRDVIKCCLDSTAFSVASDLIAEDNTITYDAFEAALCTTFCGDDYKRSLESVLCYADSILREDRTFNYSDTNLRPR